MLLIFIINFKKKNLSISKWNIVSKAKFYITTYQVFLLSVGWKLRMLLGFQNCKYFIQVSNLEDFLWNLKWLNRNFVIL